ncbi:MAG: hypothetical protein HRT88_04835 [Lentisphaeraceae bacterium]|nr:hypothetical protein [Lentisphaeraceae bacterium]
MLLNLHDNWAYSHFIDYDSRMITLFTMYPHSNPCEYTDVTFDDVKFHYFEMEAYKFNDCPANILFDIEEIDSIYILKDYIDLFQKHKKYGWPEIEYQNIDDLDKYLKSNNYKCYDISATCGISGFVFAKSMRTTSRKTRFTINENP